MAENLYAEDLDINWAFLVTTTSNLNPCLSYVTETIIWEGVKIQFPAEIIRNGRERVSI